MTQRDVFVLPARRLAKGSFGVSLKGWASRMTRFIASTWA